MTQLVLITGAGGQLGRELTRSAGAARKLVALDRSALDIGDADAVSAAVAAAKPSVIINAAAYTAVDKAESEPELAHRGNALGAENLARAAREQGARFIHISTDFVFNGDASRPYEPGSPTAPVSEYGRSKLLGERAVQTQMDDALIIRTGWVYSAFGGNFVKTMLRLMAERDELGVVADQVGTPTWARGLAGAIWAAVDRETLSGIYHWSDAGVGSWYDFAVAIAEEATGAGLLSEAARIRPITAASYPTPAARPAYSVLDKTASWQDFGLEGTHWRSQLRAMLRELKEQDNE